MKVANCTVRDAYRRAISKVWGLKQKDIKRDIHIGRKAPGQWSPESTVEIYCEGNIPNATDMFYSEFGTFYHSEEWHKIDDLANVIIQKKHPGAGRYHHEPYNNAVITVWPS
jgi:hypothetical protein